MLPKILEKNFFSYHSIFKNFLKIIIKRIDTFVMPPHDISFYGAEINGSAHSLVKINIPASEQKNRYRGKDNETL